MEGGGEDAGVGMSCNVGVGGLGGMAQGDYNLRDGIWQG